MKKLTFLLILTILLMSIFSMTAMAKESITVWGWGVYPDALEKLVDDFNEKYPDIEVNIEMIGWGDMGNKLMASMAAGEGGPDLATVSLGTMITQYANEGGLADLTEYVEPIKDEFTSASVTGAMYNGKIYGIPADIGPYVMFYRKDILEAAGVDPESIKTWGDFIEAGKKVTKDTDGDGEIDQYMLPWPKDIYEVGNWNWDPMMRMAGGNIFDQYGNVVLDKLAINYEIMEVMKEITDSGIGLNVNPWKAPWNVAVKEGKVACVMAGAWFQGNLKQMTPETAGKWRVMPAPAFVPGVTGSMGGTAYIIPKHSDNVEAAVKFAKYSVASNEGMLSMIKNAGLVPAYTEVYEEPYFDQGDEFFGGQNVWDVINKVGQNELPTFNVTIYSNQVFGGSDSTINHNVNLILNDEKTIEEGLSDAADKIRELMNQ